MRHHNNIFELFCRDLKPENILIGHDNVLRIADFGLARVWSDNSSGEMTGGLGTPTFMAPEMLRSGIPCTEKVDIYSFAVVCWALMLTRCFHAPQILSTIALQEFCPILNAVAATCKDD